MRRLPVLLHVVVYKNDRSSAFLPGCACVHLPTMTPRVKPPHTLVSVLHWLWYCRATALSALASLTLLLGKNTLPFPAFGNLNFVSPPHRRAYTSIPQSCPNIRFPHQQDFFPIRSVTKSLTARFSHENLVEKFKIFVQDFVPIRTALRDGISLKKPKKQKVHSWRNIYMQFAHGVQISAQKSEYWAVGGDFSVLPFAA